MLRKASKPNYIEISEILASKSRNILKEVFGIIRTFSGNSVI